MTAAPEFRALPRIDGLVAAAPHLVSAHGSGPTTTALRAAVDRARQAMAAGASPPTTEELVAEAARELRSLRPRPPQRVLNATGVIIHTNLGRSPLSAAAMSAVAEAGDYCDVEYNLTDGSRGSRTARLQPLLRAATGAEAGIAVNNAAAALTLSLAALATGRQVLVSRGELVEIGGSFRLPEIMTAAGVKLLEVGTTNRTRAADYDTGNDVGLILKVHPSNYRIEGFVQAPTTRELAKVAAARGVPLVYDVGSGLLAPRREPWLRDEPDVRTALEEGADLVICSGDKLVGGPQAGLLVGRSDLVSACASHPLARAVRLDKLRLAALVPTLDAHVRSAPQELPVWAALLTTEAELRARLETLAASVDRATIIDGTSVVGGGAAPGLSIPTPVLRLDAGASDEMAARLRAGDPPVIVRIVDGAVTVDLRTVSPADDEVLVQRLAALTP